MISCYKSVTFKTLYVTIFALNEIIKHKYFQIRKTTLKSFKSRTFKSHLKI